MHAQRSRPRREMQVTTLQRLAIEEDLKAGRLRAITATSSLELGIDMGAVDLVVQVESPGAVARGLQRIGRAGHQVGATSRGIFFPKFRGDLVQTSVVAERMRQGQIEAIHPPRNPLDVLAQQVVAMVALDEWAVPDLLELVRRAAPFATLTRGVLDAVLDMLASGVLPQRGFIRQEDIALDAFLANRFGHYYAQENHGARAA